MLSAREVLSQLRADAVVWDAASDVDDRPMAVYLSEDDHAWSTGRRGVWWPHLQLWVDRMELEESDTPPTSARTYPLLPTGAQRIASVHGQVQDDVAHVLVTGADRAVITQASARFADDRDLALLTLTTLILAAGRGENPTSALVASATPHIMEVLGGMAWAAPGWSLDVTDLPARVVAELGTPPRLAPMAVASAPGPDHQVGSPAPGRAAGTSTVDGDEKQAGRVSR